MDPIANQPTPVSSAPNQPVAPETPKSDKNDGMAGRIAFFIFLAVVLIAFYYFTRPEKAVAPTGQEAEVVNNQTVGQNADNTASSTKSVVKTSGGAATVKKTPAETKVTAPPASNLTDVKSIVLSSSGGGKVSWKVSGYAEKGYEVVWSKNSKPTDPVRTGDKSVRIAEPDTTSATLDAFSGAGTYYVRVCEYSGDACGLYSNEITVNLGVSKDETPAYGPVKTITLSSLGNGQIVWRVDGYSDKGFEVVWSKISGPTYPNRSSDRYLYYGDPQQNSATVDAFDNPGYYFVRVCEYLSGICGVYSNEIKVSL